jgi:hypothetical protein
MKEKKAIKSLEEMEKAVEMALAMSREGIVKMYHGLEYIKTYSLHKQSPLYRKATFDHYVEDRWNISLKVYAENIFVVEKHPDKIKEFGIGLVAKVRRCCGPLRVDKVFEEIEKYKAEHKRPLTRTAIEDIITKNKASVDVKITKAYTDWQAMYDTEKAAHALTQDALDAALTMIDALQGGLAQMGVGQEIIAGLSQQAERARMQA